VLPGSPASDVGAFLASLSSTFAREEYMSTYSCPESRMISYMISSVIDRRMNRSFSRPS
jgi:hypothetical protein